MAEKYKTAFAKYDRDHNGWISTDELNTMMKDAGKNLTESELQKMYAELDRDGNGKIFLDEFLAFVGPKQAENERLLVMFKAFDSDNSGSISASEIRQAMSTYKDITDADAERMLRKADKDGNGMIDYEEFSKLFL